MLKLLSAAALVCGVLSVALPAEAQRVMPPGIVGKIRPRLPGSIGRIREPAQIALGRRIFETETFDGNGRTCATCHPRSNNFTLDAAFIRTLPRNDPLFVFERIPELAGLENGPALRNKGLILENLDGFDRPGVLRGVQHIFALGLTTNPEPGFNPVDALGWGGDGAPGTGSLREFAVGAIVQHMPRTLNRIEGEDFRMPTAAELDALEAFQLSIGRRSDPVVDPGIDGHLEFADPDVTIGQTLVAGMPSRQGTRRCTGCHTGGGAMNDLNQNEQRANGNEVSPESPACFFPTAPGDGGFGRTPSDEVRRASFCIPVPDPDAAPRPPITTGSVTFQGNRFFSTQSAIEAADTMPAFHDNSAATLEDVVEFYDSDIFNDSITGAGNGFIIPPLNRNRIAAFLRAMNVLENIRGAIAGIDVGTAVGLVDANRDTRDAVRVLRQGAIRIHQNDALPALRSARVALQSRRFALARVELERARGLILD